MNLVYSHSYGVALQRIPTTNLGPEQQQQTIESSTQLPWLPFVHLLHTAQLLYPYPKQLTSWQTSLEGTQHSVYLSPFSSES